MWLKRLLEHELPASAVILHLKFALLRYVQPANALPNRRLGGAPGVALISGGLPENLFGTERGVQLLEGGKTRGLRFK